MKTVFRRVLCCLMSVILIFGSCIAAFAADESNPTPVVVINDIDANPIRNVNDGSVVFDFSDYQFDLLFTTGFSENFAELFSPEILGSIANGEIQTLDLIMMLVDYLGFGGDVNTIVNKVLELVTTIMGNIDSEELDLKAIIEAIDIQQYINDLKAQIKENIENIMMLKMNDDGTPANPETGAVIYPESLEYYYDEDGDFAYALAGDIGESAAEEVGYDNTFVFSYDWRVDPIATAEKLGEFIDGVKESTGADKVSIISEGYGSLIATTYLADTDKASADIKNFVTVSSEFMGTSVIGDYFKGDLVNEFTNLNSFTGAYIRYINDVSNNPITAFSTWLVNYILNRNGETHSFCLKIEQLISSVNYVFASTGITAEIAKMPGIWALVPAYDFDEAAANIYGDNETSPVYELASSFKDYQYDYESILIDAKDAGVNVSVVASWDLQIIPIGNNHSVQSDGIVDTEYASFGATCISLNSVAEGMKATQINFDGHNHLSSTFDMLTPDYKYAGIPHYIDASTCALPENTWFIKNMKHGSFNWESNSMEFLMWLLTADSEKTVWQDVAYKQFMTYNRYINPGILSSDGYVSSGDSSQQGGMLLGDINLDGLVTALDASLALRIEEGNYYVAEDSVAFKNGDVVKNGIINDADSRKILLMSAGLIDYMLSGVKFDYDTEQGELEKASYSIELRPSFNPIHNQLELELVLLDAKDSYCGNFIIKYDNDLFTYASVDEYKHDNGNVVAGAPVDSENTLSCAFSFPEGIDASECDSQGDLPLAKFYLDVTKTKKIDLTSITAGAAYFYEVDDTQVFIEPVSISLNEDFFFMLGDADNNRNISANDARLILRIAAKIETVTDEEMFRRCDVDGDGVITAKDARLVLRASAKLINSFDEALTDET